MYEAHFGLKNRPFGSKAEGTGVFVGPEQSNIMTSLKKGLAASDAIVTVTGPVGVGKTTIVSRALESISPNRMVARVGRMQLAPDEVLELLLAGFGVNRQSKGTLRRFAAFRRLLNERAAAGAQVAIVVEDALRIGVDALAELEALTAADTGDTGSANIVLMGPPELNKLLTTPELARIHQRTRLRQTIDRLSAAEVHGYMKHCIREAGGDYDAIFEDGIANIVYRCSEGIPRIINTLCATAMSTAAETGAQQVSVALMRQVAADAFGFEPDLVVVPPSEDLTTAATTPVEPPAAQAAKPEPVAETEIKAPAPEVIVESGQYPDTVADNDANSPAKEAPTPNIPEHESDDIPELINDTSPDLKQLDVNSVANDAESEFDIESTQTQKRPAMFANDDAADGDDDEPDFDLDQALSPETDSTNLMPGLTPNLDQLAAQARMHDLQHKKPVAEASDEVPHTPTENLPTLSDSMRVDVEVEVERAKKIDADQTARPAAAAEPVTESAIEAAPEQEPVAEPAVTTAAAPASESQPEPEPVIETASVPEPEPVIETAPVPEPVTETASVPEPEPVIETAPEPEPEPVRETASSPEPEPEPEIKPESVAIPETGSDQPAALSLEPEPGPEPVEERAAAAATPTPKKPAKRIPDIDALEAALDSAKKGDFAQQPDNAPLADLKLEENIEPEKPVMDIPQAPATDIPEITLDDSLPTKNTIDPKIEKCAAEIGSASSLEDISDFAAETIFGNEAFDEIAAAVTANPPVEEPSPVMLQDAEVSAAANDAIDAVPTVEASPKEAPVSAEMDASAKNRLAMVNALNNEVPTVSLPESEHIELGEKSPKASVKQASPKGPQPEPIENQINTSMTQTLKALSAAKVTQPTVEEDEKPAGGLFSRFRRSS